VYEPVSGTTMPAPRTNTTDHPENHAAKATTGAEPRTGSVDVLSEVLRAVRLRGAVFYSTTASTPWVAEAPPARELAPHVMPGADHVIEFHVITSGACWGQIVDGEPVRLETGDVVCFPQGDPHVLASSPGMRGPVEAEPDDAPIGRLPIHIDYGGSGRDPVKFVCGFLACDSRPFNPLLSALPRIMHMARASGGDTLEHFIKCAVAESESPRAGGEVVLARLSELLFIEVVRRFVGSLESTQLGWLSGLRDEVVGRALSALHARPADAWTLEGLAREVGASRSALAQRFVDYVGVPPMQYLAQWRMQLAARLLETPTTLAQIAGDVGYGSEAAFSRAFKKIVVR
jgi:AraC-like DNA-binding protein